MDTAGNINDLGRQYIGANSANGYTPGVVNSGNGALGQSGGVGELSRSFTAPALFGPLAAALFVVLLI